MKFWLNKFNKFKLFTYNFEKKNVLLETWNFQVLEKFNHFWVKYKMLKIICFLTFLSYIIFNI